MRPIAEGLFTETSPPRLIGGRHRTTGQLVFPRPAGDQHDAVLLGQRGTIWSYTIQRFRPKSPPYAGPADFKPYAMAYVELPGELIVESRLTNVAFDAISIGMAVELTLIPLDPAVGDAGVLIHAFQPVETDHV
ncbi:MAG: Zn-ribbon domain-containing OB-fold protein [Polymorphobacter sp.]